MKHRYSVELVIFERTGDDSFPNIIHHIQVSSSDEREVMERSMESASLAARFVYLHPPVSYDECPSVGPGEHQCQLGPDHESDVHSHQIVGPQGVLGNLYWEMDPEEGLLASWKPERGAFETEKDWKARQARYRKQEKKLK